MNKFREKGDTNTSKFNETSKKVTTMKCEIEENVDSGLPNKENNLEDVFKDLKLSGRYHIRSLLLISFLIILNAGQSIQYIFAASNVSYGCKHSDCTFTELSKLQQNSTSDYKCQKYELFDDNGTCTEDNFDVSSFTDCSEWVYDEPNSFVAEFNLECKEWKRTFVGTSHSIGFMIGLLVIGPMSDKFGRKRILIFSMLFAGVVGLSKSMVTSYWLFITLETLEPMLGDIYSTAYTMVVEMMTTKNRHLMVLFFAISDGTGGILVTLLAYLSPNWRILLITLYSPAFIAILYIFWLDESPRWLLVNGRKKEAEQIIKKAARINNKVIDESKIVNLKSEERSNVTLRVALNFTFSSKKLVIRLMLCFCMWFTALFNAYSLLINSVSLEGDKFINFGLVCLSGTSGGFILLFVLKKFKRKGPLILSLTLTGAFCVSQSFVPKGHRWLSMLLYLCGKINAGITIKMVYLYTTELFPTYTRNTMLALCSAVGRIGTILAPLTPLLLVYWSGFSTFLVGILSLITACIVTMMPDTADNVLPDDVKEAEVIGTKDRKQQLSTV